MIMSSQGRGPDGSTEEERRGEANGVEEKANGVDVGAGNTAKKGIILKSLTHPQIHI